MRCRIRYSVKIGAADNAYAETFNKQFLLRKIDLNGSKLLILCNQPDLVAFPAETLDGDLLSDTSDNDLTVMDILVLCTASKSPSRIPMSFMLIPPRTRKR